MDIKKLFKENLGAFISISGIVSLSAVTIIQYGRAFYFTFDLEYFTIQSYSSSIFLLSTIVILIITIVLLTKLNILILRILYFYIYCKIKEHYTFGKFAKSVIVFIFFITLFLVEFFLIGHILNGFIEPELAVSILRLFIIFTGTVPFILLVIKPFFTDNVPSSSFIKFKLIGLMFFLIVIVYQFTSSTYTQAKDQRAFKIITTDTQTKYVVISEGKFFSAYECDINTENGKLTIYTNQHKYFDLVSTDYDYVQFDNVSREQLILKAKDL